MSLTPTAKAILGFLSLQPRSGYEIRSASRRSARMFWGVNDGQLYPQLHALHDQGLIVPLDEPGDGGPPRQRWRLTAAGREALGTWLAEPPTPAVLRDEALLKVMFADQFGTDALRTVITARRAELLALQEEIQHIQPGSNRPVPDSESGLIGPGLVHSFGLEFVAMSISWCDQALHAIGAAAETGSSPSPHRSSGHDTHQDDLP
jgi:DNA-binding PadR family transcriptional regulator